MKTKIHIKSILGTILFEYEKENNTIKDTVIEAVKSGADLSGADLGEFGKIQSTESVLTVGNIDSRNGTTIIFHTDKGIYVKCGCFRGSLDEFVVKVKETHQGNKHERDYLALVEFVKIRFRLK